jgi:Fe2+ or Zn2+ uptake regulation protein
MDPDARRRLRGAGRVRQARLGLRHRRQGQPVAGRRVAANSVYRILDLFVGANLARRVESANAYVANDHPDCLHDCIFLICDSCGNTTHLDDDKLAGGVRAAASAAGFSPERPVIEVAQSPKP